MEMQDHWEHVYQTKSTKEVSWYQPHLQTSLEWIMDAAKDRSAAIIDVGGGASTLAEDLLANQYLNLTVLDLSETAINICRERMGEHAKKIAWRAGDATTLALPPRSYDVWHDRAVFHFLTDTEKREAYARQLVSSLRPGGHVVMATFGPQGPMRCSGLDATRYDAESLHRELGTGFRLVRSMTVEHKTPSGSMQQFLYCHFTVAG